MCDSMVRVAPDGVLFAKNSDRDPNEAQVLDWRPAANHDPGSVVDCTWISIPQVDHTRATLLSRPWWMWGAEMGTNDAGVVIGNEAVFTDQPLDDTGLLGMDLLRLALERATTAEGAVGVIVELLERHGQGGSCSHEHPRFSYHNSFLVADPSGAWVLETAGRKWATEAVTEGARSISNGLTISGFDHHRDALRSRVAACEARRGRTQAAATAAGDVGDLMAALRDHGGGDAPRFDRLRGAMRAPCVHAGGLVTASQTTGSLVSRLGRDGELRHWATATAAPCTSIFKPVAVSEPVDLGPAPTNRAEEASTWWRHERLHRATLADPAAALARFGAARDRIEAAWLDDPPSSAEAFATAARLEDDWLADLAAAGLPDRRPRWLRTLWARTDRAAGFGRDAATEGVHGAAVA